MVLSSTLGFHPYEERSELNLLPSGEQRASTLGGALARLGGAPGGWRGPDAIASDARRGKRRDSASLGSTLRSITGGASASLTLGFKHAPSPRAALSAASPRRRGASGPPPRPATAKGALFRKHPQSKSAFSPASTGTSTATARSVAARPGDSARVSPELFEPAELIEDSFGDLHSLGYAPPPTPARRSAVPNLPLLGGGAPAGNRAVTRAARGASLRAPKGAGTGSAEVAAAAALPAAAAEELDEAEAARTSEDVAAYYMRFGAAAAVKFFTCERADGGGRLRRAAASGRAPVASSLRGVGLASRGPSRASSRPGSPPHGRGRAVCGGGGSGTSRGVYHHVSYAGSGARLSSRASQRAESARRNSFETSRASSRPGSPPTPAAWRRFRDLPDSSSVLHQERAWQAEAEAAASAILSECSDADRPAASVSFRPYDLVVVPRERASSEHFTISAAGVVHVVPGEVAEFTPLGEWLRERTLYGLLRRLLFFRRFRERKTFGAWRRWVAAVRFSRVRARLAARLFVARPTFVRAVGELLALARGVGDINSAGHVDLVRLDDGFAYPLKEFGEAQAQLREAEALPAAEAAVNASVAVLERVCREVVSAERARRAEVEALGGDTSGITLTRGRAATKSLAMSACRLDKQRVVAEYNSISLEVQMLGRLVRLADYLLVGALAERALAAAEALASALSRPPKGRGIFVTHVAYAPGGAMVFSPSLLEYAETMRAQVLDAAAAAAGAVPRVMFMRAFSVFPSVGAAAEVEASSRAVSPALSNGSGDSDVLSGLNPNPGSGAEAFSAGTASAHGRGLTVADYLAATPRFEEARADVQAALERDFAAAARHAAQFEELREVHDHGENWDAATYEAEASQQDVAGFAAGLETQDAWRDRVERMRVGGAAGALFVDSKLMRTVMAKGVARTREAMRIKLLAVARGNTAAAIVDFRDAARALASAQEGAQKGLPAFVAFVEHYNGVCARQGARKAAERDVDAMFRLLSRHYREHRLPPSDLVKLDDAHEASQGLAAAVCNAEAFVEEQQPAVEQAIEAEVSSVNEELTAFFASLYSDNLHDPEQATEEVIGELGRLRARLEELNDNVGRLSGYQALFGLHVDDFPNLAASQRVLGHVARSWEALIDVRVSLRESVDATDARELAAAMSSIEGRIAGAERDGKELLGEQHGTDKRVALGLLEAVKDFRQKLPLLAELACTAMRPRHWVRLLCVTGVDEAAAKTVLADATLASQALRVDALLEALACTKLSKLAEVRTITGVAKEERAVECAIDDASRWLDSLEVVHSASEGVLNPKAMLDAIEEHLAPVRRVDVRRFASAAAALVAQADAAAAVVRRWEATRCTRETLQARLDADPDLRRELPRVMQTLETIDSLWGDFIHRVRGRPCVVVLANDDAVNYQLTRLAEMLDEARAEVERRDAFVTEREAALAASDDSESGDGGWGAGAKEPCDGDGAPEGDSPDSVPSPTAAEGNAGAAIERSESGEVDSNLGVGDVAPAAEPEDEEAGADAEDAADSVVVAAEDADAVEAGRLHCEGDDVGHG